MTYFSWFNVKVFEDFDRSICYFTFFDAVPIDSFLCLRGDFDNTLLFGNSLDYLRGVNYPTLNPF